jgi:hypothetical protein
MRPETRLYGHASGWMTTLIMCQDKVKEAWPLLIGSSTGPDTLIHTFVLVLFNDAPLVYQLFQCGVLFTF